MVLPLLLHRLSKRPERVFAAVEEVEVEFAVTTRALEGVVGGRRFLERRKCQLQLLSRAALRKVASIAV